MWRCFNCQNLKVEKKNHLYTVSFPTLEKLRGPVIAKPFQVAWLEKIVDKTVKHSRKTISKEKEMVPGYPHYWDVESSEDGKMMGIDIGLHFSHGSVNWLLLL